MEQNVPPAVAAVANADPSRFDVFGECLASVIWNVLLATVIISFGTYMQWIFVGPASPKFIIPQPVKIEFTDVADWKYTLGDSVAIAGSMYNGLPHDWLFTIRVNCGEPDFVPSHEEAILVPAVTKRYFTVQAFRGVKLYHDKMRCMVTLNGRLPYLSLRQDQEPLILDSVIILPTKIERSAA